jgi:hypothetical protein
MATDIKGIIEGAAKAAGTVVGTAAGMAAGASQALVGRNPQPKALDPMAEELYWREHHASEPYFDGANFAFEDYLPAWQTGWEGRAKYAGRSFEDAARELEQDFQWNRGKSRLLWEQAREAVRAAFARSV